MHKKAHNVRSFHAEVLPDTGATTSIISQALCDEHRLVPRSTRETLRAANSELMEVTGRLRLRVDYQGNMAYIDVLVSPDLDTTFLMSWGDLQQLGVISASFPDVQAQAQSRARAVTSDNENVAAACAKLRQDILEEFPEVFSDTLGSRRLKGKPMRIHLKEDNVRPKRVFTARPIPLALQKPAQDLLDRLLADGIIVRVDEPTEWISPAHFVPKPDGSARLVTDFTDLNKLVLRPVHPFPSTRDIIQNLDSKATVFAKLDATHGYFQIPLDEESSYLTTFLVPQGKFRYTVAPMGLNASGDEFCARSDVPFYGHEGTFKLVDDGLTQGHSIDQLRDRLRSLLLDCRKAGITLSKRKFDIGQKVKFAGHVISKDGVFPDPAKLRAITDFPVPTDLTGLRSFLGLANQLAYFVPDLAQASEPLRGLLQKDVPFVWLPEHDIAFAQVKTILTSEPVVQPFDPLLPTELYTDASRLHGLGFALLQRHKDGTPRLIRCGSRSLNSAEKRYATIELECLGVYYGIKSCEHFLQGISFHVVTDHRPLLGIFAKDLHQVGNPRLLRLREKIVGYNFTVSWVAGKRHQMADALSRAPVFGPQEDEGKDPPDSVRLATSPLELHEFVKDLDEDYLSVMSVLPTTNEVRDLPPLHPARAFASVWDRLSVDYGLLVLDGYRVVVPHAARERVLRGLHASHCGVNKTRQLAAQLYFWPGMNNEIRHVVEKCDECTKYLAAQQKEVTSPGAVSALGDTYPMSDVAVDLFHAKGKDYLLMVDRHSGYPFVQLLSSLHTAAIVKHLRRWFCEFGYPRRIRSDNGPQFRSEFGKFCTSYAIEHEKSSPYHPESNGLAEVSVKSVKHLLLKCLAAKEDFGDALLAWRDTPRADGVTPSVLFFGRRLKTHLPAHPRTYGLVDQREYEDMVRIRRGTLAGAHKRQDERARQYQPFRVGDYVVMRDPHTKEWEDIGQVKCILDNGRSYSIEFEGKEYVRNRLFLRPFDRQLFAKRALSDSENSRIHSSDSLAQTLDDAESSCASGFRVSTSFVSDHSSCAVRAAPPARAHRTPTTARATTMSSSTSQPAGASTFSKSTCLRCTSGQARSSLCLCYSAYSPTASSDAASSGAVRPPSTEGDQPLPLPPTLPRPLRRSQPPRSQPPRSRSPPRRSRLRWRTPLIRSSSTSPGDVSRATGASIRLPVIRTPTMPLRSILKPPTT